MDVARVSSPPDEPLMIYDGDCQFCSFWIRRWQRSIGSRVKFVPFQSPEVGERFPEIPRRQMEESVQLIETDGGVYQGAEAVLRALALQPRRLVWWKMYRSVPGFAPVAEWSYRLVARHRSAFSALTKFFFGNQP